MALDALGFVKATGELVQGAGQVHGLLSQAQDINSASRAAFQASVEEAQFVRAQGQRQASGQRAGFGAAGVEQSGTAAAVQLQTIAASVEQANRILFQANKARKRARKARGNAEIAAAVQGTTSLLNATAALLGG